MPQPLQTAGQLRAPLFLAAAAIIAMASPPAYAEGSAQTGANQALFVDPFDINVDTVLNVYVAELGEVINISAGNSDGQNVYVTIVNPAGTTVVDDELLTPARGELAGDLPDCAQDIPNPFQYVTGTDVTDTADDADPADTSDGQYVITFRVGANDDSLETATIYPYDITVTDDASEAVFHCAADGDGDGFIDQEPTQAYKGGRLHSARWSFNAGAYDNATDADFFILVPGGRPQESYVWLLDLNGLAGYWYDISGNYTGVDSPDADGVAVAGFSVPEEGNSVTPMFEIYLAHPEEAFSPGAPPTLTGFRFRDDALVDNSISPGNEDGIQDEGNFYFTSDVEGTYAIFIDGDDNGIFDPTMPGDILLSGRASEGLNSVYFDGRDNTGAPMNPGVHMARMSLRAGEYHFVGRDIESSLPGIRILDANDPGVIRPGTMYWNDTLLASTETFNPVEAYPDGLSSGEYADAPAIGVNTHSWGTQDENSESNETYIDTYVFGAEDTGVQRVVVTSGSNANISTSTMTVTVDGGGTAGPGSTMIYTVTFINTSTIDDATDVTFTNLIPDGVTLVPGSLTCTDAAATTAEGSTLTVEGLTVPAGTGADAPGTVVCTYSVTVDDGTTGTISNQGSFTWDGGAVGGLTDGDADTPELETTDITIGGSGGTDTDGDGLSDDEEELIGTDPNDPDTDGDGLTDGDETGMDGMYDEGTDTDPNDPDTDGDGLSDGDEVTTYGTDPLDPDTDGGGVSDGDEVLLWQTDPLDAADDDEYAYSGGSCATVQPGADGGGWLLLFAVFALTFFLRRKVAGVALALLVLLCAQTVHAQNGTVNTQAFAPSPFMNDLYNVELGSTMKHLYRWDAGLYLNYQNDPLVLRASDGDVVRNVVAHQLTADFLGAFAILDWLDVGLAFPMHLYQGGDGLIGGEAPSAFSVGDLRLHVKARIVQSKKKVFSLAFAPYLTFPTGQLVDGFSGSAGVTFVPQLAASFEWRRAGFSVNAGYRFAKDERVANLQISDELIFRLGGFVWFIPQKFSAIAELLTSTRAGAPFAEVEETPVELLAGLRYFLFDWIHLNLGAGGGLTKGYAMPDFRIFAGAVMTLGKKEEPVVVQEGPGDRDEDGILDDVDECPRRAEDKDGFEDADGCPDKDNDDDGILDVDDKCPNEAEDKDRFEDKDGCPDPDNDGDGILDVDDKCPDEAEDKDGFEDADGCPDKDNDGDGILDVNDKCPNEPETVNGKEDDDGCPDAKARVQGKKIIILEKIFFEYNSNVIMKKSYEVLNDVVDVMKNYPQIKKVRVEGHTDTRGKAPYNKNLSAGRAKAVKDYLVKNGVEPVRLESVGYGEERPLVTPEQTEDDFEKNRRVEFEILETETAEDGPRLEFRNAE